MQGRSMFVLGNMEAVQAFSEQMLALTTEIGDMRGIVRSLNLLGMAHNTLGHYQQAEECIERATMLCQKMGDRSQIENLRNSLGVIAMARGDYRAAFVCFQSALTIAREIGDREGELFFLSNLGEARLKLGEYQAAEADLRQVIQAAEIAGSGGISDTYSFLAEACLGQGKTEEALAAAQRALALGRSEGYPAFLAAAWRVLGRVVAQLSRPAGIEDADGEQRAYDAPACFTESLRICDETGMRGERARTLRAWAQFEIARGDPAHGAAIWEEARAIFAELGADLEVERMSATPTPSH
jgi:tetratricopeptide (TPR) repeat protein